MTPCLDKTGREIVPGSIIAYGHALGRCAALRIGKVKRVAKSAPRYPYANDDYGSWRITVRGIEDTWYGRPSALCSRDGTLMFPDRCIVLDPAMLTDEQRQLLEQVTI